jgi:hypothetical protein
MSPNSEGAGPATTEPGSSSAATAPQPRDRVRCLPRQLQKVIACVMATINRPCSGSLRSMLQVPNVMNGV